MVTISDVFMIMIGFGTLLVAVISLFVAIITLTKK
ncbi:putative holin-like toxin [Rossellomorea marisflavi]